jgi:4-hydroxybenzoate polyprenyltransferase
VQDVPFDREGGISSIATVFGARFTVIFSTLLYTASALLIAYTFPSTMGYGVVAGIALYALNTSRFIATTDEKASETNAGWRLFLGLNAGLGAFITNAYIFQRGFEPVWLPFVAASATYTVFLYFLRKR